MPDFDDDKPAVAITTPGRHSTGRPLAGMQLQVLGVGLSRTGTVSLTKALARLGYETCHFHRGFSRSFPYHRVGAFDFRAVMQCEAATDLPTALFYREFLLAWPGLRCVLTVRDEDAWWTSIERHFRRFAVHQESEAPERWHARMLAYGSVVPHEALYRKRFREHNAAVRAHVPPDQLLEMDITAGEGWEVLCRFLGKPRPDEPFPFQNVGKP
ncbi:MAG: sulfotransferase family protein [Pseudomonadota bacterium]